MSYQRNVRTISRFANITVVSQVRFDCSHLGLGNSGDWQLLVRYKGPPGEALFVFISLLSLSLFL